MDGDISRKKLYSHQSPRKKKVRKKKNKTYSALTRNRHLRMKLGTSKATIRISNFISSKTLQNSIIKWTIPKTERFKKFKNQTQSVGFRMAPSTKNLRAASIGLGKKAIISAAARKNAKCYPAPNRYRITSQF